MLSTARNILNPESRDRARMRAYANQATKLHIVVLSLRNISVHMKAINEGNLRIYATFSRNKFLIPLGAFFIGWRIVKEERDEPLVISAQDPFWTGWIAWLLARRRGTKLHIQVHGDYLSPNWGVGAPLKRLALRMALFLLRRAPTVRVVSERIKRSLVGAGVSPHKITVLPIRPELEQFLARARTAVEGLPYTLLFVGRFAPEKNIERILEAFAELYERRRDIRLRLVGAGALRGAFVAFIKQHKLEAVVSVEDWVEDVPSVMAEADALLLASKHEAYGLVLIEAMAVGLPLITTDVGCVGEIVKDGVHGIVVKEEGAHAFAVAIETLLSDPEKMHCYGSEGRKTAEKIAQESEETYLKAWVNAMR